MLNVEERAERKQENAEWLEAQRVAVTAVYARHEHDVAIRDAVVNRVDGTPPFWGNRYDVERRPYGNGKFVWDVVDTSSKPHKHVVATLTSLKRDAQEQADSLNRDPTANFNGERFPSIHNRSNVFEPIQACDCSDLPKLAEGYRSNVCGQIVLTYCATHGKHDKCPRDVRAVGLTCDPERLSLARINLNHDLIEVEWKMIDLDEKFARLEHQEIHAEELGLSPLRDIPSAGTVKV